MLIIIIIELIHLQTKISTLLVPLRCCRWWVLSRSARQAASCWSRAGGWAIHEY